MDSSKFKHIKLLLMDVDGVLTRGSITYAENGDELKSFNVKDGLGLRMLSKTGVATGIVTGRHSAAVTRRCKELAIAYVFDGVGNKAALLPDILQLANVASGQTAFIGDDLPDLALMSRVGLAVAVADAHEEIRKAADIVTSAQGGAGAVREVCEQILKAQGHWERLMAGYRKTR